MNLQTLLRSIVGLLIGCSLCVSFSAPAQAGYGNHAERATANIQARVATAKIYLELEGAERRAVADRLFAKQ
jgi:hypothetical protein